jgi:RNA polymerase sigma-70 factor, ECF subfamily
VAASRKAQVAAGERVESISDRTQTAQQIVAGLQGGASIDDGFNRLYRLFYATVAHFFAKRGFSPEDSLDLTQETFVRIYKGIGAFRQEARFDTWLFTIATNVYREQLRRQSTDKRAGQEVPLEQFPNKDGDAPANPLVPLVASNALPLQDVLDRERSERLREAIESMPEQMRKCLILRVYHDMRYREISAVLRLSTETVKVHLFQARRRLRHVLGDYFELAAAEPQEAEVR